MDQDNEFNQYVHNLKLRREVEKNPDIELPRVSQRPLDPYEREASGSSLSEREASQEPKASMIEKVKEMMGHLSANSASDDKPSLDDIEKRNLLIRMMSGD